MTVAAEVVWEEGGGAAKTLKFNCENSNIIFAPHNARLKFLKIVPD